MFAVDEHASSYLVSVFSGAQMKEKKERETKFQKTISSATHTQQEQKTYTKLIFDEKFPRSEREELENWILFRAMSFCLLATVILIFW